MDTKRNKTQEELEIEDSEDQEKEPLWPFLFFLVVPALWFIAIFLLNKYSHNLTENNGHSFDGANSFFSALAFAGVVIAIFLQKRELKLQRKELRITRRVLRRQKQQLEEHTKAFNKQNFESTFFKMLDLHQAIVNTIRLETPGNTLLGRECFSYFYQHLVHYHDSAIKTMAPNDPKAIDRAYGQLYDIWQAQLGHYFRHLYNIVRFVKENPVANKEFYTRLVRAQLSVFELSLLFYNCLSPLGREKFKPLVEEFTLLKTIEDKNIINPKHREYYEPTAFEKPPTASAE